MHSRCSMPVTTIARFDILSCFPAKNPAKAMRSMYAIHLVPPFAAFGIINATTRAGLHISISSNRFVRVQRCVATFVCTSAHCTGIEQIIGRATSIWCHNTAITTNDAGILVCENASNTRNMRAAHKNELHQYTSANKNRNMLQDNRILSNYKEQQDPPFQHRLHKPWAWMCPKITQVSSTQLTNGNKLHENQNISHTTGFADTAVAAIFIAFVHIRRAKRVHIRRCVRQQMH